MTSALNDIFGEEQFKGLVNYLDDICLYTSGFDQQLEILEKTLKKLDEYQFRINTKKACFFENKIKLLGMEISNGSVTPSEDNIEAIKKIGKPKNVKQVRGLISSFLGISGDL